MLKIRHKQSDKHGVKSDSKACSQYGRKKIRCESAYCRACHPRKICNGNKSQKVYYGTIFLFFGGEYCKRFIGNSESGKQLIGNFLGAQLVHNASTHNKMSEI